MISKEELDKIEKELEKSSNEYFKKKPEDVEEEFKKETTLGSPNNLVEPTDLEGD